MRDLPHAEVRDTRFAFQVQGPSDSRREDQRALPELMGVLAGARNEPRQRDQASPTLGKSMEPQPSTELTEEKPVKPPRKKRFWTFLAYRPYSIRSVGCCFPFSFREQSPSTLAR